MAWTQIGDESDVPVNSMYLYTVMGEGITVYHLAGDWYATADRCTHQDCSLSEGDIEENEIVCACHGGAFDIRTGVATRMPCIEPLETYPIRVVEGRIEIDFT